MWYHLTDMIHGRGQRKRVEYVGETRKKQGIPAVIWCFYSGQSRPDRIVGEEGNMMKQGVLVWRRRRVNAGRKRER